MLNIENERKRFETWHYTHFGRKVHRARTEHGGERPGLEYWGDDTNTAWEAWQEARRASPAAAVPEGALPPLPRLPMPEIPAYAGEGSLYTTKQMQEYARAAVEADRAQRPGGRQASKTAETRMDTGFDGGDQSADRAQQGEPVYDHDAFLAWWDEWVDINTGSIEYCVKREAAIAAWKACCATKAAAPADAPELPPLYAQALDLVHEAQRASVSLVQRRLRIGWNEARDLVQLMHDRSQIPDAWLPPGCYPRRAAPVPDTGIPTAGEVAEIALNVMKRERAVTKAGFALAADLLKIDGPTVKGVDYVPRDALCSRIVAWRMEMDKAHKVNSQDVRAIYTAAPHPSEAKAGESGNV